MKLPIAGEMNSLIVKSSFENKGAFTPLLGADT
jgi:hypothetical protein